MKKCVLCKSAARMHCESDQASLCWDCDAMVHSANFLVAKHSRTLLCHACQSPTPWTGSGPKLGPTVSVCEACSNDATSHRNIDQNLDPQDDMEDEDDDNEDDDNEDEDDDNDDDGDNQVVPLSWNNPVAPSMVSNSCSSSEELRFFN